MLKEIVNLLVQSCRQLALPLLRGSLLLLCPALLHAQQAVSIATNIEPATIEIGAPATLTVVATYPEGATIEKVDYTVLDQVYELEVLSADELDKAADGDNRQMIFELKLTFWLPDTFEIPGIPIEYKLNNVSSTKFSETVRIQVTSPPVEQDSLRLMPIKGIIAEPINFRDALPFLIGLLLIGGMIAFFYYRNKREKAAAPPPPPMLVPAHRYARVQLDELEQKQLWQQGDVKGYHSELTRILRQYISHRYRINALEITTDEILRALKKSGMEQEQRDQLQSLLKAVDLVKFAKAEPPASFHSEAGENVVNFVETTRDAEVRMAIAREALPEALIPDAIEAGTTREAEEEREKN